MLKLEKKLQRDLDIIMKRVGAPLIQKSLENWITSGDKNTKFYHASSIIRKGSNRIKALKSLKGD